MLLPCWLLGVDRTATCCGGEEEKGRRKRGGMERVPTGCWLLLRKWQKERKKGRKIGRRRRRRKEPTGLEEELLHFAPTPTGMREREEEWKKKKKRGEREDPPCCCSLLSYVRRLRVAYWPHACWLLCWLQVAPLMSGWAGAACAGHDEGVGVLQVECMRGLREEEEKNERG